MTAKGVDHNMSLGMPLGLGGVGGSGVGCRGTGDPGGSGCNLKSLAGQSKLDAARDNNPILWSQPIEAGHTSHTANQHVICLSGLAQHSQVQPRPAQPQPASQPNS